MFGYCGWLVVDARYALVQVHNIPDHLGFTALPFRLRGVGVLLDLHDLTPEFYRTKWGKGFKRCLITDVKLVEKISCDFSHHMLTTSEGFKDKLVTRVSKE